MDYKSSRDATWRLLIKHKIGTLPIDVMEICRGEKIPVFTYRTGRNFIEKLGLEEHVAHNDAFSVCGIIFYDDTKPMRRCRFSIAHELGHIILHTDHSTRVQCRATQNCTDDFLETEANIFASRLLSPLGVLQLLDVNSAREIYDLCEISYSAAKLRYARLCEIRRRSSERRYTKNHGTFLLSRLEREVVANFEAFIEEYKRNNKAQPQLESITGTQTPTEPTCSAVQLLI